MQIAFFLLYPLHIFLCQCTWLCVRRTHSGSLLTLRVCHVQLPCGQWGSGMCSCPLVASMGRCADQYSSAAMEMRGRQMSARGRNQTLALGCKHPSSWASFAACSNGTMPSLTIQGMFFWGGYFLVFCFPWLLLLDQYCQKCDTMCFWHLE